MSEIKSANREASIACCKRNWQRINDYMTSCAKGQILYPVVIKNNFYWLSEDGKLESINNPELGFVAFKLYI